MTGAGIGRMVIERAWERYSEWLREVEEITVERTPLQEEEKEVKEPSLPSAVNALAKPYTDLKFI